MSETRAYLNWHPPDGMGECDRCHAEGKLWRLPSNIDTEPDADWMYCSKCFALLVRKAGDA